MPWWERVDTWVGILIVAACVAFIFVQLEPSLLFRNTTPAGGDTAAHVWWPAYLRDHLLPFRLAGWSPDFYGGFPAGQYYFPFPALVIVAFDVVMPYNVAFKLGTALGPLLLPIGAYVFGRGLRAAPDTDRVRGGATGFLFFTGDPGTSSIATSVAFNQRIAGGTLASTLAGEFSFTIAMALALAFFGTLAHSLQTGQRRWLPAVLLAGVVTSHLVVAIFAAMGAFVIWLAYRPVRNLGRIVAIGGVGVLLTAVWSLPLLATLGYTTDMRYAAITQYGRYLFPHYFWGVRGIAPWDWGATVLLGIALVAVALRRGARATPTLVLVTLTALCGLTFRLWESLQSTTVWNLRFLPFWYLCLFLILGLGAAEGIRGVAWLARRLSEYGEANWPARIERALVIGGLVTIVSLGALAAMDSGKSFLPYWVRWNYRGYEDSKGDYPTPAKQYGEYRAFINAAAKLPPGRLVWEGNSQLNVYGSPLALMLLPYWTHGRISSMEGVYFEASATTPYHFMTVAALVAPGNASNPVGGVPYRDQSDFKLGVRWLQQLGVSYFAAHSPQAEAAADADPRLRLVATSPDRDGVDPLGWRIYRVAHSELVEPVRYQPVVVDHVPARDEQQCERKVARLLAAKCAGARLAGLHRRAVVQRSRRAESSARRRWSELVAALGTGRGTLAPEETTPHGACHERARRHRHRVLRRLAHWRAGVREDVVLPQLGSRRRERPLSRDARRDGGDTHQSPRHAPLRHDRCRVVGAHRHAGGRCRPGRARRDPETPTQAYDRGPHA